MVVARPAVAESYCCGVQGVLTMSQEFHEGLHLALYLGAYAVMPTALAPW